MSLYRASRIDGVTVMRGNTKLGKILNVSLPPRASCCHEMPCFTEGCYAMRFFKLYPSVKRAWSRNWHALIHNGTQRFGDAIITAIQKCEGRYFRWHVGGDIPSADYLDMMMRVAHELPQTSFMCYTKKYRLIAAAANELRATPNLRIILSMWPGLHCPADLYAEWPAAWLRDPRRPDDRIPVTAKRCKGSCDNCLECWLDKGKVDYVFPKH